MIQIGDRIEELDVEKSDAKQGYTPSIEESNSDADSEHSQEDEVEMHTQVW